MKKEFTTANEKKKVTGVYKTLTTLKSSTMQLNLCTNSSDAKGLYNNYKSNFKA